MKLFSRKLNKANANKRVKDTNMHSSINAEGNVKQQAIDQLTEDSDSNDKNYLKNNKIKKTKANKILPTDTIQERIKTLRTLCRLSRPKLSAKYNLSFSTIRSWENNDSQLSNKSLHRLISLFRREGLLVDEAWLLTGQGIAPTMITADKAHTVNQIDTTQTDLSLSQDQFKNQKQNKINNDSILNPIQSEVDAFLLNNNNAQVIMVDQGYPIYRLNQGDFVGGVQIKTEDLIIGQVCLALMTFHYSHSLDQVGNLNYQVKTQQGRTSSALSIVPDQLLQLCQIQRLDLDHVIVAPLNSLQAQWHQYVYPIDDINKLYRVCWIRNQTLLEVDPKCWTVK